MAQAQLNFDENTLDKASSLYNLYSRLLTGFTSASQVESPDFSTPPLTPEGELDEQLMGEMMGEYNAIMMKNSAYLFANSFITVLGAGGEGGLVPGGNFISRDGDSMAGNLDALNGFKAGANGTLILNVQSKNGVNSVEFSGNINVSSNATVGGTLSVDKGLFFVDHKAIYYADNILSIDGQSIALNGNVGVSGELTVGSVNIKSNGIFYKDWIYYHSGNSNTKDVDWHMADAYVEKSIAVKGDSSIGGSVNALSGFSFSLFNKKLLYSADNSSTGEGGTVAHDPYVVIDSDITLINGHGIKCGGSYVIKAKSENAMSFTAPGMIMGLGDSFDGVNTLYIALHSDIKDYTGSYTMVSSVGDGYFPNSFSAGCGNSLGAVITTFYDKPHAGVIVNQELRFNSSSGPMLASDDGVTLNGAMSYSHMDDGKEKIEEIGFGLKYGETTSLFRDLSKPWSATLNVSTDAEFVCFNTPVESVGFSIKSEQYKTRLIENTLFFSDSSFLEGVVDGIRHSGNSYFDGNLSSRRFASGFAGYGWAIKSDPMVGGISATFDEMTIRKKLRIYELEVQKISVTNGSLWVSDSCSGDDVKAL